MLHVPLSQTNPTQHLKTFFFLIRNQGDALLILCHGLEHRQAQDGDGVRGTVVGFAELAESPGGNNSGNRCWQELVLANYSLEQALSLLPTPLEAGVCQQPENVLEEQDAAVRRTLVQSASLHLPALHSSCRLVIRYLKNSYTDHAMAVEGIW